MLILGSVAPWLCRTGRRSRTRGTREQPGRRVAQKAGRNRQILVVGFAAIRAQLAYKTTLYGRQLVVVGRWLPSSNTCSECGAARTKLALSKRTYHCPCGQVKARQATGWQTGSLTGDRQESPSVRGGEEVNAISYRSAAGQSTHPEATSPASSEYPCASERRPSSSGQERNQLYR